MRIGIVSDTHGYFDERLVAAFENVEAIIHAGDVGGLAVLEALQALAPVSAVQGNNDLPLGGLGLPVHLDVVLEGLAIHVVHELRQAKPAPRTRVVVSGHSHRPLIEQRDGKLFLNPGAAGRVGFHTVQTAALLDVEGGRVMATIIELGPRIELKKARRPAAGT
jgi:putative phosphoesterase